MDIQDCPPRDFRQKIFVRIANFVYRLKAATIRYRDSNLIITAIIRAGATARARYALSSASLSRMSS